MTTLIMSCKASSFAVWSFIIAIARQFVPWQVTSEQVSQTHRLDEFKIAFSVLECQSERIVDTKKRKKVLLTRFPIKAFRQNTHSKKKELTKRSEKTRTGDRGTWHSTDKQCYAQMRSAKGADWLAKIKELKNWKEMVGGEGKFAKQKA